MIKIEKRVLSKLVRENEHYQQIIAKLAVENDALSGIIPQPDVATHNISRLNELLAATTNSYDQLEQENTELRVQNEVLQEQFSELTEQFNDISERHLNAERMIEYYDEEEVHSAISTIKGKNADFEGITVKDIANELALAMQVNTNGDNKVEICESAFNVIMEKTSRLMERINTLGGKISDCGNLVRKTISNSHRVEENAVMAPEVDELLRKCQEHELTNRKLKNNLMEMQRLLTEKEDCIEAMREVFIALQADISTKIGEIETDGDVELNTKEEIGILKNMENLLGGAISRK